MRTIREALSGRQLEATVEVVHRVRGSVEADLMHAVLFGSRARAEARPDSDVDVLLIFRWLPSDREPQASHAEALAEQVARESRVPVTVWSVSLPDLRQGWRTPMLVDALRDAIPVWPMGRRPAPIEFTADDAAFCARSLLQRVREGGDEVASSLWRGEPGTAARRARDDLARLCTANLLLDLCTRPRCADAIREFRERFTPADFEDPLWQPVASWAIASYGPTGKAEQTLVLPPPGGVRRLCGLIDRLRKFTQHRLDGDAMPRPSAGRHSPCYSGIGKA
jgi:hypothetical protein